MDVDHDVGETASPLLILRSEKSGINGNCKDTILTLLTSIVLIQNYKLTKESLRIDNDEEHQGRALLKSNRVACSQEAKP